jgi:hypothetical protein
MPYFTRQVAPNGLIVLAFIGVSQARRQALLAAGQTVPAPINVQALVDTGATCTCVDPQVLKDLSLSPNGSATMITPSSGDHPIVVNQYDVSLVIPASQNQPPLFHANIPVVESKLHKLQGFHMLLGRDVLKGCLLTYDGLSGLFSLAY